MFDFASIIREQPCRCHMLSQDKNENLHIVSPFNEGHTTEYINVGGPRIV